MIETTTTQTRWTTVQLTEPSDSGYVYVGATSGPWRLPFALPRRRRRALLRQLGAAASQLALDPRVSEAHVFRGTLRPPGEAADLHGQEVPPTDALDAVLMVETVSVDAAEQLADGLIISNLRTELDTPMVFAGRNVRRIAPVDHGRRGVFLFNYFSADDVATNLDAWQFTAGWFQDQTNLNNSTVVEPVTSAGPQYTLVNHCRWDHYLDVVPALVLKPSFRRFVLRVFAKNRVVPRPILYALVR